MDRRESLKLLMLAAVGSEQLIRSVPVAGQDTGFASEWHEWPNVRWAGPEYWGNRLQDWSVRGGQLVCGVRARDRTLHCLTHTVSRPEFTTAVEVMPLVSGPGVDATSVTGFRLGLKGRVDDVRSAAVHGVGLDVGVDGAGAFLIGDRRSAPALQGRDRVLLEVTVIPVGEDARVSLVARPHVGGPELATFVRDVASSDLLGNCALLSHVDPGGSGTGAVFDRWTLSGPGLAVNQDAAFGPIMFAQYTLHRGILKLTAQLAPIEEIPGLRCRLDVRMSSGSWTTVDAAAIDPLSRTARFRVEGWDAGSAAEYRLRLEVPLGSGPRSFTYHGTIAAEPGAMEPLKAAVFSCNADHGFPDGEVVEHVLAHRPDLALFLGDQFYEGSGGFGIQTDSVEVATLDMLHKWYMFGWSYRDIFRHVPVAFIPDDHDVYHGNVWGEGGRHAPTENGWGAVAQDQGGYKMPAEWVNAVQVTQTSHLPDPYDPTPVEQGIDVYYTRWDYGGVSFAILEDRKFKSAPANVLPAEARVLNGWIQNPDFDVRDHRDLPNAELLGPRQMAFLEEWAEDWSGAAYMKVALSQTNFAAVHTIPQDATSGAVLPSLPMPRPGQYVEGDKLAADMDSNGWPAAHRDEALRILRRCAAFHIAGDQHLATIVRHGIDDFGDAGFSFTGPALNNIWPRRWWPPRGLRKAPLEKGGAQYTGDYFDAFGNRVTVHASANPRATGLEPAILRDRVTGYGIVTFDKAEERITLECWPRQVDPRAPGAQQYDGWPMTVSRDSGDGRRPAGTLPTVRVRGVEDPVVEVRSVSGALIYARRIRGTEFTLPVFEAAPHIVRVGDTLRGRWLERRVNTTEWGVGSLDFDFTS
ncbi:MAG: alkaline phosphatase D family protein [Longimicrobiales bacterium]